MCLKMPLFYVEVTADTSVTTDATQVSSRTFLKLAKRVYSGVGTCPPVLPFE
jgi:hypothetical protein